MRPDQVVDKDMKSGECLGVVRVSCRELAKETMISGWKTLTSDSNVSLDSYIKFTLSYSAVEELSDSLVVSVQYRGKCSFNLSSTREFPWWSDLLSLI